MRSLIRTALCLFAAAFVFVEGCSATQVKEQEARASYMAMQLDCVDRYSTRAAIDECRDQVRARWLRANHITEATTVDSGQHLKPDPWPFPTDAGDEQ